MDMVTASMKTLMKSDKIGIIHRGKYNVLMLGHHNNFMLSCIHPTCTCMLKSAMEHFKYKIGVAPI